MNHERLEGPISSYERRLNPNLIRFLRLIGGIAIEGAFGSQGLNVLKKGKIKKVKAAKEGLKAVINPAGQTRKALKGVRDNAKRRAVEAALSGSLGYPKTKETSAEDNLPRPNGSPEDESLSLDYLTEDNKPSRRKRVAKKIRGLLLRRDVKQGPPNDLTNEDLPRLFGPPDNHSPSPNDLTNEDLPRLFGPPDNHSPSPNDLTNEDLPRLNDSA